MKNDIPQPTIDALSAVPYFAELDPAALRALLRSAVRRTYQADEVIFLEGEPCAGLYLVEEGWLKIVRLSPEGREQALRFVGPGEVFNEVGVFAATDNPATAIALAPAAVWVIGRPALLRLLDAHPDVAQRVIENLAQRVLRLVDLVEDLSLRTVEARLARLLLERAAGKDTLPRQRWATQTEMAARLGTVLDVLNRALHRLAGEGLIRIERQQIEILDREGLRARAMIEE